MIVHRFHRWLTRAIFMGVVIFLYAPIFTIFVYSFNHSKRNVIWSGFSMKYYALALTNPELLWALANSFLIAIASAFLSLLLGSSSAYVLWRFRFPFRHLFDTILSLPIVVPEMCMGIAIMMFFSELGWLDTLVWPFDLLPIIVAHTAFTFPFVTILIRASLEELNFELLEAAWDLGAHELNVFWRIIMPHIGSALVSSFLLALSLSLDDFLITFFTTAPGTTTLPLKIYSMIRFVVSPEINAISTILLLITLLLAIIGIVLHGKKTYHSH